MSEHIPTKKIGSLALFVSTLAASFGCQLQKTGNVKAIRTDRETGTHQTLVAVLSENETNFQIYSCPFQTRRVSRDECGSPLLEPEVSSIFKELDNYFYEKVTTAEHLEKYSETPSRFGVISKDEARKRIEVLENTLKQKQSEGNTEDIPTLQREIDELSEFRSIEDAAEDFVQDIKRVFDERLKPKFKIPSSFAITESQYFDEEEKIAALSLIDILEEMLATERPLADPERLTEWQKLDVVNNPDRIPLLRLSTLYPLSAFLQKQRLLPLSLMSLMHDDRSAMEKLRLVSGSQVTQSAFLTHQKIFLNPSSNTLRTWLQPFGKHLGRKTPGCLIEFDAGWQGMSSSSETQTAYPLILPTTYLSISYFSKIPGKAQPRRASGNLNRMNSLQMWAAKPTDATGKIKTTQGAVELNALSADSPFSTDLRLTCGTAEDLLTQKENISSQWLAKMKLRELERLLLGEKTIYEHSAPGQAKLQHRGEASLFACSGAGSSVSRQQSKWAEGFPCLFPSESESDGRGQ